MAAYAWTPSALMWPHVNGLINGLHKQISFKNCLFIIIGKLQLEHPQVYPADIYHR